MICDLVKGLALLLNICFYLILMVHKGLKYLHCNLEKIKVFICNNKKTFGIFTIFFLLAADIILLWYITQDMTLLTDNISLLPSIQLFFIAGGVLTYLNLINPEIIEKHPKLGGCINDFCLVILIYAFSDVMKAILNLLRYIFMEGNFFGLGPFNTGGGPSGGGTGGGPSGGGPSGGGPSGGGMPSWDSERERNRRINRTNDRTLNRGINNQTRNLIETVPPRSSQSIKRAYQRKLLNERKKMTNCRISYMKTVPFSEKTNKTQYLKELEVKVLRGERVTIDDTSRKLMVELKKDILDDNITQEQRLILASFGTLTEIKNMFKSWDNY